ncbi:sucrase ferredoxin [Pedococcus bigeumensis]|uniref:Sucrase ferredoxin n=1 Tax=Pedococcus bigeumensis TaxID=433644 RepID=A0A502CTM8_9MICO|nr:sucrase ferredoxin [Pedococcus bigeumensis]TPG16975.1 sucrase ferredoxin [Pedococcus bigeumensis]
MTTPRCSTSARQRGDPLIGTAAPATRWLLVEHPGGWAPVALDSDGISPDMADRLHRAALSVRGRVVLVRRPVERGAGARRGAWRRWGVVDLDGRQQWGTWTESDDLRAALAVLVEGPAHGSHEPGPAGLPPPLLLVCTHGRHDICCAVRGRPVALALAARWPDQAWECTHIGGDRFAANVLVVPDGTVYGSLDPESAVDVLERHLLGTVDTEHLRGFSAHPPPVQAALAAVLRAHGPAAVGDVRPGAVEMTADDWRVEVLGAGEVPARTEVTVHRTRQPAARLTCRAESDASAFVWTTSLADRHD